jgi:hypothetical protein
MLLIVRFQVFVLAIVAVSTACAAPVTGWTLVDASTGGATTKSLTDANTDSPVIGTGVDGSASQVALYAPISGPADTAPDVSLVNGQTVTLTGAAMLVGVANSLEQFRFGLFYEGSAPVNAKGWLGYIANNSAGGSGGALRAKRASYSDFDNLLFAATSASGSSSTLLSSIDGGTFASGTYDFSMSITRLGNALQIDASLTRGGVFAQAWSDVLVTDPDVLTYNFNRVGFLSGNSSSADQVLFSNIDVATSVVNMNTLTLQVLRMGPDAGAMRLVNRSGEAVDFEYYEITSDAGSLDASGWQSLDDQSQVAPPAGWHEAGGVDEHLLSEANITGSTSVDPDGVLNLGRGFDAGALEDLQLSVGLTGDRLVSGIVEYINPGDFNADGIVNATDLAVWKGEHGPGGGADADFDGDSDGADFLAWQRNLSSPAALSALNTVPEASSLMMIATAGIAIASCRRFAFQTFGADHRIGG